MKLLKYSNSTEKKVHGSSGPYIESFKKKVQEKLKVLEAKSEVENDTIKFKRIVRNTTHSGMNKIEGLKILREGFVRIEKIDSTRVQILWEIKLDSLMALSVMIGLLIGLIAGFAGATIAISIIIGLLFSTIAYSMGYSAIRIKIDGIVETSI